MDKSETKMISKGDIYLIVVILFLVISALLWRYFTADEGAKAVVTIDGTVKEELKLVKDAEVKIVTAEGYNIIKVQDGKAYVAEADCRDHICVSHQPICVEGETIVCLPHKLVVEVKE